VFMMLITEVIHNYWQLKTPAIILRIMDGSKITVAIFLRLMKEPVLILTHMMSVI